MKFHFTKWRAMFLCLLLGMVMEIGRSEETHWSLRPIPRVPATPSIDEFIRAKLSSQQLRPSPEADRATLIRRLCFDLIGLPPTPEEVAAFTSDKDPAAYEKLVDRLLASPQHGERWARHWLDTIHFADTHGFEHDVHRPHAWRFRDYVIRSFNEDKPWQRFVQEQLAADVLFPAEPQLTAALGFLGAGPFDASADGTAPAAFEYVDRDDLVTQTMGAFVSTTANCARCHAHKFDPITQEDYFSLQAVFAGVGKGNVSYDEDPKIADQRKRWTTLRDATDAVGPLQQEIILTPENDALVNEWETTSAGKADWKPLALETFVSSGGSILTKQPDGSVLASGPMPETEIYVVTAPSPLREISALRLDLLPDDSLPFKGPGRAGNGNLHVSEFSAQLFRSGAAAPENIPFSRATADYDQVSYGAAGMLNPDPKVSWAIHPKVGMPHHAVLTLAKKTTVAEADKLVITLKQQQGGHLIGRFRLSATNSSEASAQPMTAEAQAVLSIPRDQRTPEQRVALAARFLNLKATEELAKLPQQAMVYAASAEHQAKRGAILKAPQTRVIRVLTRGDLDKPGAEVGPGSLSAITALPARFANLDPQNEGLRRASLAEWMTHHDNPLLWRSVVNRVWHYHFGRGICDTPSDFGKMGGVPSHLELLDWLAAWFRDEAKGSVKSLHRLIVTSATYRQSSAVHQAALPSSPVIASSPPDANSVDPDNQLLWRMNRSRLDADCYRDAVMAVSGRLDLKMGGPGIAHYNASPGPQATPVLDYAGFDWEAPGVTRRSIYRVVYRGIADPFMETMDFPDMGLLSPARGFSASALQSLTLFNNGFLLSQCNHLAARAIKAGPNIPDQLNRLFQLALLRSPTQEELSDYTTLAQTNGLPAVARVLFNTNEFLFVN